MFSYSNTIALGLARASVAICGLLMLAPSAQAAPTNAAFLHEYAGPIAWWVDGKDEAAPMGVLAPASPCDDGVKRIKISFRTSPYDGSKEWSVQNCYNESKTITPKYREFNPNWKDDVCITLKPGQVYTLWLGVESDVSYTWGCK